MNQPTDDPLDKELPLDPPSETIDLVRRHQAGEADALPRLLAQKEQDLRRIARNKLRRQPAARDFMDSSEVVQEVALEVVRNAGAFQPRHRGAFQAWVATIAWRKIRDLLEKMRRHTPIDGADDDDSSAGLAISNESPSPSEAAAVRELQEIVKQAESELTEQQREVFRLRHHEGLSSKDVAERLGMPGPDAVDRCYARAKVTLARFVGRRLGLSADGIPEAP